MPVSTIEIRDCNQELPDNIDAIVEEQDTCLLLGKAPVIKTPVESFPALVKKMEQQNPRMPGEVLVIHSIPKKMIAIIYDLDQKQICRKEWIETAIKNILQQCRVYQIRTLAMPLPGITHGRIDEDTSLRILDNLLAEDQPDCLKNIYLITA